jgi:MFS transporter, DHA1 family, tetracycline resistance protein
MRLNKPKNEAPKTAKPPSSPERREMFMRLGLLTIAVFINLLGFSIIIPLIPYYIVAALHLTGAQVAQDPEVGRLGAWLIAAYAGMQFLFAPVWGRLSDKVGRKPILIGSLIGDAVFYSMFALSQHSIGLLFASRILAGIFSSASISVAQAYVADVTPPEYRAAGLGHIGAAFGLGFILGPAIGGGLGQFNLGAPLYVAAALAIANAIYIVKWLPESRTEKERSEGVSSSPSGSRLSRMAHGLTGPIGFLFLLTFLVTFAFSQLEGTFTAYLVQNFGFTSNHSAAAAGGVFAYIGIILVLIQGGAIRPLAKRFGETPLVLTGVVLMAIGFLTFPLVHSIAALMLGPLIPISVGAALNNPSLRSLVSRMAAADIQGGVLGLSASFDSLARFLGPATAGLLYKSVGVTSPYWTAGAVMAIAFLFALSQRNRMVAATTPTIDARSADAQTADTVKPMEHVR